MSVTYTLNPDLLDMFADGVAERVDEAMRSNAFFLAEVMKELTPKRTGATAESISVDESWLEYAVGSDSPVFNWLDQGTAGHGPIIPVYASALHWTENGEDRFARYVLWVSGIEPLEIVDTAVDMASDVMDANIVLAMDAAWDESG